MPEYISHYDSGHRLEPRPWVRDGTTAADTTPRPAEPDDYGRVDFNNDMGETVFTAWMQKTETGYILRVDEYQDAPLTVELSSERDTRQEAMQELDKHLHKLANDYSNYVTLDLEDPDTFGVGHYVLRRHDNSARFVITEEYTRTDTSDPDRVPDHWTYVRQEPEQRIDGTHYWSPEQPDPRSVAHSGQLDALLDSTKRFAEAPYLDHMADLNKQAQRPIFQPGSQLPPPPPTPPQGYAM